MTAPQERTFNVDTLIDRTLSEMAQDAKVIERLADRIKLNIHMLNTVILGDQEPLTPPERPGNITDDHWEMMTDTQQKKLCKAFYDMQFASQELHEAWNRIETVRDAC